MIVERSIVPLGEAITLQRGFDLPAQDRIAGQVPIVSSSGISGTHVESRVSGPGVVTGRYGTIGQVFYLTEDFWPLNTTLYVRDFKGNDKRFVHYLLASLDFSPFSDKSSVPGVNRNHLHLMPVPLPPLAEQQAIAEVLGALDDKIELNRRMNTTLEELARTIFRSWFVDFDPVHAKAEGRAPFGMDADTAALFPDSFVPSELGDIPAGWTAGSVYDLSRVIYGAPFASKDFNTTGAGVPLLRIRDLTTSSPQISTEQRHPKGEMVQAGDILVGMDGEFRAYLWIGPEAWLNQRVSKFVPTPPANELFLKYSLEAPLNFFERSKTGTTVIHLGKADIDTMRMIRPSPGVLAAYSRIAQPFALKVVTNAQESRTLAELRDTLLPKLLSGEITVKAAERELVSAT